MEAVSFCLKNKFYTLCNPALSPSRCLICKENLKDLGNAFLRCHIANWFCGTLLATLHQKVAFTKSIKGFVEPSMVGYPIKRRRIHLQLIQSSFFESWLERNNRIFDDIEKAINIFLDNVFLLALLIHQSTQKLKLLGHGKFNIISTILHYPSLVSLKIC